MLKERTYRRTAIMTLFMKNSTKRIDRGENRREWGRDWRNVWKVEKWKLHLHPLYWKNGERELLLIFPFFSLYIFGNISN